MTRARFIYLNIVKTNKLIVLLDFTSPAHFIIYTSKFMIKLPTKKMDLTLSVSLLVNVCLILTSKQI